MGQCHKITRSNKEQNQVLLAEYTIPPALQVIVPQVPAQPVAASPKPLTCVRACRPQVVALGVG